MKVAVVTDDGESVSQHFGRARYYAVFEVDDGKIVGQRDEKQGGAPHFCAGIS